MHGAYWLLTRIGEAGETEWCVCAPGSMRPRVRQCLAGAGGNPAVADADVATQRYVVPRKVGVYEFKCTVVGHEGMKGLLEVVV